jgi:hypothetical protein
MNAISVLHVVIASYFAATLGATALAKLTNWRTSASGMLRENIIPMSSVPLFLFAVTMAEFSLATLLALGIEPVPVGFVTAALFMLFAGYRLVVARRTKAVMCSCAGTFRIDPASPPIVAGSVLACLIQAACACVLAFDSQHPEYPLNFLALAAWIAPVIALALGVSRRPKALGYDTQFPREFYQLGTAELRTRR